MPASPPASPLMGLPGIALNWWRKRRPRYSPGPTRGIARSASSSFLSVSWMHSHSRASHCAWRTGAGRVGSLGLAWGGVVVTGRRARDLPWLPIQNGEPGMGNAGGRGVLCPLGGERDAGACCCRSTLRVGRVLRGAGGAAQSRCTSCADLQGSAFICVILNPAGALAASCLRLLRIAVQARLVERAGRYMESTERSDRLRLRLIPDERRASIIGGDESS